MRRGDESTPGIAAVRVMAAVMLTGALDVVVGFTLRGAWPEGMGIRIAFASFALGHAAVVALIAGGAAFVIGLAAAGRIRIRGRSIGSDVLIYCAAAIAFFEWANLTLFEGASVKGKSWRPAVELGARIAIPLGVLIGAWIFVRVTSISRRRGVLACGLLGAALGILWANARILRGLYEFVHLQEVVVAFILCAGACCLLRLPLNQGAGRVLAGRLTIVGLTALFAIGGVAFRFRDDYRLVSAVATARATALTEYEGLTNRIYDLIHLPAEPELVDVSGILAGLESVSSEEIQSRLDDLLPRRREMNVLWIAVDTVRADHCSFITGSDRKTTPNLDELGKTAFVFTRAQSSYPTSNYSYSSVLTSLYPRATPAYKYYRNKDWEFAKEASFPGLLSTHDIRSVGITAFDRRTAQAMDWFGPLRLGFEVYNPDQKPSAMTAPEINASAFKSLATISSEQWFMWLHYLEPHAPYDAHEGFDFGSSPQDLYDGEIAFSDSQIGEVIQHLKDRNLYHSTIIVVFSDHGEEFLEHNAKFHNNNVYQTQIHVPLLISIPGLQGRKIDVAVNLVDVLPTLVDILGIEDPARRMGRSLVPAMLGDDRPGLSFSEWFGWRAGRHARDQRALIYGDHKIIQRPYQKTWELYDVVADPGERDNLVGRGLPEEAQLLSLLEDVNDRIERYHGAGSEAAGPSAKEKFTREVEDVVARLERAQGAPRDQLRDVVKLRDLLWNSYYDVHPDAADYLGDDGVRGVVRRVMAGFDGLAPVARNRILLYVGYARLGGEHLETCRKVLASRSPFARLMAAMALGRAGYAEAAPTLREALASPKTANKQMVAVAAAALGLPEAEFWFRADLYDTMRPIRVAALRELGRMSKLRVPPARMIRQIYASNRYRSPEGNLATIEGLSDATDPDALLILTRLYLSDAEDVREAARRVLLRHMSEADLARNREALAAELEADLAVTNNRFSDAVKLYRHSLSRGTMWNSWCRMRLARAQHAAADVDGAKATLETVARESDVPADRLLAQRRLEQLDSSAVLTEFSCEIDAAGVRFDQPLSGLSAFRLKLPVKNTTAHDWQGGMWRGGFRLEVVFETASGERIQSREYENWLPEEGVNAGESAVIDLVGVAPRKTEGARLLVIVRQNRIHIPNGGRIYVHPDPVTIR